MKRPFSVNNLDTDKLEIPEKLTTTNIANLITPKIQVFPIIDNINTILEQRNDFSPARDRSGKFIHAASLTSSPQQKPEQYNSYASLLKVKSIPSGAQSVQNLDSYSYSPLIPIKNASTQDSNVHINLETQDYSDMEEFNDEPPIISNVHLNGKTPHSSPYKKSMKNIVVKMNNSLAKLSNENTPVKSLNNVCWDDVHHNEKTDLYSREELPDNMMHFQHHHNIKENSSNIDQEKFQRKARSHKKDLLNDIILTNVIKFLDHVDIFHLSNLLYEYRHEQKYKSQFKKRFIYLVLKGFNEQQQYSFWDIFVKFKELKQQHPTAFTQNFVRSCRYLKDILKDVDRTLPEYDKYSTEEGKSSLLRVLVAVTNSIQDNEYFQGLNSIVGVFLFYLKEEESFWITLYLFEKLQVKNFFKDDFKMVHLLNYQFEVFLHACLPTVAEHLKFQSITLSYITTPWFITLYSYFLSLPKIIKVWNFYFIKGKSFLIQFGLGIFSHFQKQILDMEPDEVPSFLKAELRELLEEDDSIFEDALTFKVTKRMMKEIEPYFDKGKPMLKLYKDLHGKLRWQAPNEDLSSKILSNLENLATTNTNHIERNHHIRTPALVSNDQNDQANDSPLRITSLFKSVKQDMTRSFRNLFGKTANQSNVNSPYNIRAPEKSTVSCTNSPLMQGGRLNERDEINNSEFVHEHNNISELNSPNILLKDMTQQIDNSQALPTRFETETDELDSAYIPKTSSEGKRIISQIQLKERGQVICHSNNTSLVLDNLPLEKSNSTLQPSHSRIIEEKIEKKFLSIISLSRLDLQQTTNHLNLVHNDKAVSMELKDEQNLKAALAAKLKARDYQPKVYSKPTDL